MVHAIEQFRRLDVELEINPQILRTDGAAGFGGHGLVNVVIKAGRTRISGGTFVFYDSLKDSLQWRFVTKVTIPATR